MHQCSQLQLLKEIHSLPSLCAWYLSEQRLSQHSRDKKSIHKQRSHRQKELSRCSTLQNHQHAAEATVARGEASSDEGPNGAAATAVAENGRSLKRPCRNSSLSHAQVGTASSAAAQPFSSYFAELQNAVDAGEGGQAYQLFRELQRATSTALPKPDLCNSLLRLLSRGRDFRPCWSTFQRVKSSQLRYSTLATLMDAAIKAGELFQALDLFRDMQRRGYQPNIITWCHLISSFNKCKKRGWPFAEAAYHLWQELQAQEGAILNELDAPSFAAGMLACVGVGDFAEAYRLLHEMQAAGFSPDIRAYNILLKGCAQAPQEVKRIPELLDGIRQAGLEPSTATYNTLVDAYVNAGMLIQAQQTLEEAKRRSVHLDAWAYSSLLKGLVRATQLENASKLVEEMEDRSIAPNVVTLTTLLDGWVRIGCMEEAEGVLKSMAQRNIPANRITYNTLMRGYAMEGNLQAVRDVLDRMGQAGVQAREDTFNTLMEGALHCDDPQLALQLFRQLGRLDLRPDSLSYTALITALARLSRPDQAVQAFGALEADWAHVEANGGICAISLNALIAALANAKQLPEAEEQLQRAVQMAASRGLPPPIEAYGAVLKAYGRQGDADSAMFLFQQFQEAGGEPDDRLVDVAVTACVKARQFKRALQKQLRRLSINLKKVVQFLRAMERRGKNIDKARLKTTLENVIRSQMQARKARPGLGPQKNENLERLKFWVGIPNRYYGSDSEA